MTAPPGTPEPGESTEYTVGAVARLLGVPVATLRSWNQRYGIGPRHHLPGRHRYYSVADLSVARRMTELIRAGATPASAAQAALIVLEPAPAPGEFGPLLAAAERMDVAALVRLISGHLAHHGVCDTWNRLCRPTFEAIVDRQDAGGGYIDVEHLLSWAVLTGLYRGVPALVGPGREPRVLLACTAGERHTLPLEVLRAALAERRCAALPLGADLPAEALSDALDRQTTANVVVLWSQTAATATAESVRVAESHGVAVLRAGPGWTAAEYAGGGRYLGSLEKALAVILDVIR
ncbi:MerR family transcriptional regulator [Nocardia sp. NBC_01503]|uniref:MerR family transcriptional regulator n=1 Tax=Nocardia sp. NBC_01503 TaxID=2975997 RepID=UPI002E7AF31B|nr:MerR family transcriptional regulator [Nocardia sp. NBC_01503]WTL30613.1 MerR family transcriptional regulator [Nocardia sp. NBC_01503]